MPPACTTDLCGEGLGRVGRAGAAEQRVEQAAVEDAVARQAAAVSSGLRWRQVGLEVEHDAELGGSAFGAMAGHGQPMASRLVVHGGQRGTQAALQAGARAASGGPPRRSGVLRSASPQPATR